jgi:hypothetical protein
VFNTEAGRAYLGRRLDLSPDLLSRLDFFGLSSIANVLGAIKLAKHYGLGSDSAIVTVATDSASLYRSEVRRYLAQRHNAGELTGELAAELVGAHLTGAGVDHVLETDAHERDRIFNLGYFTWVEQQGIALSDFDRRRKPAFWQGLHDLLPQWDELIEAFNRDGGLETARA